MSIDYIKNTLQMNMGKKITLAAVKGRNRYKIDCCTIENVYPGIFVVKTTDGHSGKDKRISYSYSDILTRTIIIKPYSEKAM